MMTVRQLIQLLLEECDNLDGTIDVYVSSKTEDMKARVIEAEDNEWCVDDSLNINHIEDMGGYYHLHVDNIEY